MKILDPIHPGKILKEEFLDELDISAYKLAKEIGVPTNRITEIVLGHRSISAETALLLSKYFGLSDSYWLTLQMRYDTEKAKIHLAKKLQMVHTYIYHNPTIPPDLPKMSV